MNSTEQLIHELMEQKIRNEMYHDMDLGEGRDPDAQHIHEMAQLEQALHTVHQFDRMYPQTKVDFLREVDEYNKSRAK